ncbi:hypothetical protein PAECIP112173_01617 [Paenibacillus sp. JJ-100]|uniref:hypothetical protein n=1 Tax=Paenibacillus sp. JJ-100 TaxID=2974896 RepID=UPI0022FFA937|nr:hypothetical protein [Paenibacillus sp. JJ-100]CAI6056651.1 hypothetical protein PAECIP112173_01617 [Paenibacillus sp. JJ-100]
MIMKRSNLLIADIIYVVCLVISSMISFTVYSDGYQSIAFWISLIATYVAITSLWIFVRYVMRNMERFKQFVPGYTAIGVILAIYLLCVIFYALFVGFADHVLRWFILLHAVTAALTFMLCAIVWIYIRSARQHETSQQLNAAGLYSIQKALQQLLNSLGNQSIQERKSVESIIELVKYSDPVIPASMEYTDHQILIEIELLNDEVQSQFAAGEHLNKERLAAQISSIKSRLLERNQQILAMKS